MRGMDSKRLTRRSAAAVVAGASLGMAALQPPQRGPETSMAAHVREDLNRNLETLRQADLSIFTEPSFAFRIL